MARPQKNTVEYFPHIAKPGKTLFILEGKYGNDGYAFWFKLLELLADSDNHFYDASTETGWHYLVARGKVSDVSATEMLDLLSNLGNIDADLWKNHKIIWCQALVDNLSEVYRKRKRDLPAKPKKGFCDRNNNNCDRNPSSTHESASESTQSRVEYSKGENIKDLADLPSADPPKKANRRDFEAEFKIFYAAYPNKKKPGYALKCYVNKGKKGQLPPLEQPWKIKKPGLNGPGTAGAISITRQPG